MKVRKQEKNKPKDLKATCTLLRAQKTPAVCLKPQACLRGLRGGAPVTIWRSTRRRKLQHQRDNLG